VVNNKARLVCLVAGLLGFSSSPVDAQSDATDGLKIGSVNVSGSFRTRLENWDWFTAEPYNNDYLFSGDILKVAFSQRREKFDWLLEMEVPVVAGLPDNAVAPGAQGQLGLGASYYVANSHSSNAAMIFPRQGYVRLKNLFGDPNQSLRFGRFEFSEAAGVTPKDPTLAWVKRERISQRLLGPVNWSHVGRSFDGLQYIWRKGDNLLNVAAMMPTRGVYQVDGWGQLNIAVGYAAFTHELHREKTSGDYRVFGVYYQDFRHIVKVDNRPLALRQLDLANIRIGTFGGQTLQSFTTGAGIFDATLWAVVQTGRWGTLDHGAGAYVVEGGWQPKRPAALKPWLRAGYTYTTGDDNPLDQKHQTYFQMLPTSRPYARFPFYDMLNSRDLYGTLMLRIQRVTVRPEVHGVKLTQPQDLWYLGGGAYQPGTFGYTGRPSNGHQGLATLYDVSVDFAATKHTSINGYFGHANGHSVVQSIYPQGSNGNLGYVELLYKF